MITKAEAIELLKTYINNEKMIFHCLASGIVMKSLAIKLNQDANKWEIAGILHDIDVEITNADLHTHGLEAEKILRSINLDEDIIEAIKLHNEAAHGIKRNALFHYALAASETITGLIFATAYVYPDKNILSIKPKSVVKRMKEKMFAASVNRDIIMECEKFGNSIDEFAELSVKAMQEHHSEIGF